MSRCIDTPDGTVPGLVFDREVSESDFTNPSYYSALTPEPITVIDGCKLAYDLGNVIKYISRAGHKPGNAEVKDLKKARWYLDHAIKKREKDE